MTTIETEPTRHHDDDEPREHAPRALGLFSVLVRAIARVWVTSLLLLAAAFSGIAIYQLFQTQAELAELRKSPGPEAYAVVAYRRELERQIRTFEQGWREDAVPAPPPRPRLLEEIDLARQRDQERVRVSGDLAPISAPQ
jgi:hypothetical protein